MTRMPALSLASAVLLLLVPCQSLEAPQPFCYYSLLGFLVSAGSSACPTTGTPTVVSDAYGHAGPNNGLLQYDERLYFTGMNYPHGCPECYTQWSPDEDKAKLCKYDKDGNFWYPLSDAQKLVLEDLQKNYSFFVCPFTSVHANMTDGMQDAAAKAAGIIREWAGPANMTDESFLRQMNMTGSHVPSWFRGTAGLMLEGMISPDDLVTALEYLDENGFTR